ncbi:hypothetical protein [Rhizobium sp.]|uniref:hypothetical protein n=1 Tax=Rhizobium sp. TaxID=391 RepID=UPI002898707E
MAKGYYALSMKARSSLQPPSFAYLVPRSSSQPEIPATFPSFFCQAPICATVAALFFLAASRRKAFVANAAAVFIHGGVRTLATAANASGRLVSIDVVWRQNLNVGVRKPHSHSITHPDAPKSKIAFRNRIGFPANKMTSMSWKNFRPGLERQNLKNQIVQRRRPNQGVG